MLTVFATCNKDVHQLKELFQWIEQLKGCKGHACLIVCDPSTQWDAVLDAKREAEKSFDDVSVIADDRPVDGWPQGPNSLFRKASVYVMRKSGCPFLWMEPDAIPLKEGWLDKIEEAYIFSGVKFLGHIYDDQHMSGIAVYPKDTATIFGLSPYSKKGFDVDGSPHMLAQGANTPLIHNLFGEMGNPPTFKEKNEPGTNVFCLRQVNPDAVIFHRNKDGSLIGLLRKQMGIEPPKSIRKLIEKKDKKVFVQGGRWGDLILLLPAMLRHYQQTGQKPILISSMEFSPVLDGVSYVESLPLHFDWWRGMPQMRQVAQREYGEHTVTQCYASEWGINLNQWPDFMTSMLDRAGLPISDIPSAKLVFDRRSAKREQDLVSKFRKTSKPLLLVNFSGHSSPFHHVKEVMNVVNRYESKFEIVNLGQIRAQRIYDLLGLFDVAAGAILTDSSTYHLAHASKAPYIGFLTNGWTGSIKRDTCSLMIRYNETLQRLNEIIPHLEKWK